MRRFLKKFTEGNTRNSRLINYVDVTKIRNPWFGVVWAKYAREPSRPHAHNAQSYWKHVVSLKSTKAIVLKPFISIVMVISRLLKKERNPIQFYTWHRMFSSKYLTTVANIRTVMVTREDGDRRRLRRWLCKD